MTTERRDRFAHGPHPEQAGCDGEGCRGVRADEADRARDPKPGSAPMEPPTPQTWPGIRARACGVDGHSAQRSDARVERFGVEWLMSGLRAIQAPYRAERRAGEGA